MDINSAGAAYLDDYRLRGPASGISQSVSRNGSAAGGEDFAAILKKAAAPQADDAASARKVGIDKSDKLYEQCLELETFLVKTLISGMRSTIQKSGLVDEGFAGKMYEDMLYDEYAKDFTRNANFGLAEMAYLELSGQRGR